MINNNSGEVKLSSSPLSKINSEAELKYAEQRLKDSPLHNLQNSQKKVEDDAKD